jgi:hypothetical protein
MTKSTFTAAFLAATFAIAATVPALAETAQTTAPNAAQTQYAAPSTAKLAEPAQQAVATKDNILNHGANTQHVLPVGSVHPMFMLRQLH